MNICNFIGISYFTPRFTLTCLSSYYTICTAQKASFIYIISQNLFSFTLLKHNQMEEVHVRTETPLTHSIFIFQQDKTIENTSNYKSFMHCLAIMISKYYINLFILLMDFILFEKLFFLFCRVWECTLLHRTENNNARVAEVKTKTIILLYFLYWYVKILFADALGV